MPLSFLLVPIFTDRQRVMRIPVFTVVTMVLCILVFLATMGAQRRAEDAFELALFHAIELTWGQEALDTVSLATLCAGVGDPECLDTGLDMPEWAAGDEIDALLVDLLAGVGIAEPEAGSVSQEVLDRAVEDAWEAYRRQPFVRLGLVRGAFSAHGLVTYAFLHGGWMHLLGNLLFLWLAASSIEHVWNRGFLVAFYLGGGAVAGAFQLLFTGSFPLMPLVGASGAVAALMGAYLVLFARSRVKLWYLLWVFLFFRTGTFFAPAWVALPLWFLWQLLLWSMALDDQVAYAAHVGGFAFGIAVAVAAMRLRPRWLLAPTSAETAIDAPMGRPLDPRETVLRSELVEAGKQKQRRAPSATDEAEAAARRAEERMANQGGAVVASAGAAGAAPMARTPATAGEDMTVQVRLASVTRIKDDHFGFEDPSGSPFRVDTREFRWWAVGRLTYRDAAGQAHESLVCDLIRDPRPDGDGLTVRAVRLLSDQQPYTVVLRKLRDDPAANFEQLMARMGKRLKGARYAIRPPPATLADVPRFEHVDEFERAWLVRVREEA